MFLVERCRTGIPWQMFSIEDCFYEISIVKERGSSPFLIVLFNLIYAFLIYAIAFLGVLWFEF